MKKKIFPCFIVVFLVPIFSQNGFSQLSSREMKEIEDLGKEAVSKEALKAIDNIFIFHSTLHHLSTIYTI